MTRNNKYMEKSELNLSFFDFYIVYGASKILNILSMFSFAILLDYFKFRYLSKRIIICGKKVNFKGDIDEFFFLELKFRILSFFTLGIYSLFKNNQKIKAYISKTYLDENNDSCYNVSVYENFKNLFFLGFILVLSMGIYTPFVFFMRKKFIIQHIKLGDKYLRLRIGIADYWKYLLKNILLVIFSVGIHLLFFLPRYKKYIVSNIILTDSFS